MKDKYIRERTDFDHHGNIDKDKLGEDWGDGFFFNPEPVRIFRNAEGEIVKTAPLSSGEFEEIEGQDREIKKAVRAATVISPSPMSTSTREKLHIILTKRMFDHYDQLPASFSGLNPLRDGIPTCRDHPLGCWLVCKEQTGKYHASRQEVFDWMKMVVATRVDIMDKKSNRRGWKSDISNATLRISKKPLT
jgi:hypothetical protein